MPSKQQRERQKRLRKERAASERSRKQQRAEFEKVNESLEKVMDAVIEIAGGGPDQVGAVRELLVELAGTPVGDELLGSAQTAALFGERAGHRAGLEQGHAIAEALEGADASSFSWFRVGLLSGCGDHDAADDLALELVGAEDDPDHRGEAAEVLVEVRMSAGRIADALAALGAECARDPDNGNLQALRARLFARAENLAGNRGEERRALEEGSELWPLPAPDQLAQALATREVFSSAALVADLFRSVSAFLASDAEVGAVVGAAVDEVVQDARDAAELGPFDELGEGIEVRVAHGLGAVVGEGVRAYATAWSWLLSGDTADGDAPTILDRFAAHPSTPDRMAEAARSWQRHARYGLWRPDPLAPGEDDQSRRLGTWMLDVVSRQSAYVVVPPEQLAGLPRWSVLLGPIGAVEGVWHTGPAMIVVDPATADDMTGAIAETTEEVLRAMAAEAGVRVPRRRRSGARTMVPYGVLAELGEPMHESEADLSAKVVGASLDNIIGMLQRSHHRAPRMTNTDGDPVELIEVVFPVDDVDRVRKRLLADPDFAGDEGDTMAPGEVAPQVRWLGRPMSPDEAAGSLAQARSELRRRGLQPLSQEVGPQRWLRGALRFEAGAVVADLNSRQRLEALSAKMRRAGAGEPVVKAAVDPHLDLVLTGGRRAGGRAPGDPEAEAVWRHHWLDTRLPALEGISPRAAARDARRLPLLESLLRQFEHDADLALAAGHTPLDVGAMRSELGLSDW